jgi:hypothetical protein
MSYLSHVAMSMYHKFSQIAMSVNHMLHRRWLASPQAASLHARAKAACGGRAQAKGGFACAKLNIKTYSYCDARIPTREYTMYPNGVRAHWRAH